jgi:hypothetical protein
MKIKKNVKLLTIAIPLVILFFVLIKETVIRIALKILPDCIIYTNFDIYCPSCGNTRSVTALMRGDILSSLRYNIVPGILVFLLLLAYVELAANSFGKQLRLVPRSLPFYLILILLLILYFIIRNFIPYLTP